ncbi:hypothetical protein [Natrinema ejinorense]|uniref:Uncharacterized protein n=1 Tax=Natrinema ejinorense TaxID=373386 RepID=A0A2A5QXY0_9EURY|nr:hypothetical protein [Natrinema ejinorense]PCR91691.1 hypothetical protein CP557_14845 [Natrinema ejinorense]
MGILELMLGSSGPGEQGIEGKSYTLPKETHDFVYPIAVRREEVEAFGELLEAAGDGSPAETDPEELQAVIDDVGGEEGPDIDTDALVERLQRPQNAAASVIGTWSETLERDIGVVYARRGTLEVLIEFVKRCKDRDEDESDSFELPESFPNAAALLKRLEEGTDTQYRAVVHTDLLPDE